MISGGSDKMKSLEAIKRFFASALIISVAISAFSFPADAADEPKANPSGAYLKYTVDVKKPEGENLAFNWTNFKRLDYVFAEGDIVEYDVMFDVEDKGWGHIDGAITGCETTTVFRDMPGVTDQNIVPLNTGHDLSDYAFNVWYHRVIEITEDHIGVKWVNFQIGCYASSEELEYQCITMYDNIVITNNGETKLVIFKDEADWPETRISNASTSHCKATLEMAVFTEEELDGFKAVEEAIASEEASRAASREEAKASREQAAIEASIEASIEQSIEESARQSEEDAAAATKTDDTGGSGGNIIPIISIAGGIVIAAAIIIAVVASGKKKKNADKP